MGHAWLTVCQRVAQGKLGPLGGAPATISCGRLSCAEFKNRLKIGRKELRTREDQTA